MTYPELKEALQKLKHEYDHDRFYRDEEYRKQQEPLLHANALAQEKIWLQYREEEPIISAEEEQLLIADLRDQKARGTVAFLLAIMPVFSKTLLQAMLKAAVDETNPSANRIFIEPCTRAFDVFAVNDVLLRFIESGSKDEKIGALRAFYWTRSRIIHYSIGMGPMVEELIEYRWNGRSYSYRDSNHKNYSLGDAALHEYKPKVESMKAHRQEFILDRLEFEDDAEILRALFKELPETPSAFPVDLQSKAQRLFDINEREMVLKIYEPYRKMQGVSDSEERHKIYQEQKLVVQKLKEEAESRILRNKNRD